MHNAAFHELGLDLVYLPFNVYPDNLASAVGAVRALDMVGVNVTLPHKERVGDLLDWVSEDARVIGSVNTIHNDGGVLRGYTTDGRGFLQALRSAGFEPEKSSAVVLGAGGAARATVYALGSVGTSVTVANRTVGRAVELADSMNVALGREIADAVGIGEEGAREAISRADLLVNCTSVGMHPNRDAQPIPTEWLHPGLFVFDQIYNPLETDLLRAARSVGAIGMNGVRMLVYQGAIAFEIWTGLVPPVKVMEEAVTSTANMD